MAQISIYLPDDVEKRARRAAKSQHKSVSRWLAEQVQSRLDDAWPQEILDAAGSCPDFPDLAELRKGYGKDIRRVRF